MMFLVLAPLSPLCIIAQTSRLVRSFENDDRCWDASIEEDIGRKSDHGINGPSSSKALNGSTTVTREEDDGHHTIVLFQVIV